MELEELYSKVKEWLPTQLYVDMTKIQKTFNVGFSRAHKIIQFLIRDNYIDERFIDDRGHKVYSFEEKSR